MKYIGTVDQLQDTGCEVKVTLSNVRRKGAARWRAYSPGIIFEVSHRQARRSYPIGTTVEVAIKPK